MDAETLNLLLKDRCYPLRPTIEAQDRDRYLSLDDIEAKFKLFCATHKDAASFEKRGHLVYVTGGSGSGKTSMIHRCAYHLKQLLPNAILVDLAGQRWVEKDSGLRIRRTFHEILAKAGEHSMAAPVVTRLRGELDTDVIRAFRETSKELAKLNPARVMVVLLSPEPTTEELLLVAEATQPRLVFFAELVDTEQIRRCRNELAMYQSADRLVTELKVGPLKPGDGKRLVDGIARDEQTLPAIPDEVVDKVDKWVERTELARSIMFLKRLALGVRLLADERNANRVDTDDVNDYLMMMLGRDGQ